MKEYIVIISVGPVQSMIAAARKSRDLWSGSALLSELAKACALSLQQQGADLIFPAISKNDKESLKENSSFSVGNKLQAVLTVENEQQLKDIIAKAKQATRQRFVTEAEMSLAELSAQEIRGDIWQNQMNDYVEVQAAWALISSKNSYTEAVALASKVLAARKATRDFQQTTFDPYQANLMIPKSSLDGARETVIFEDDRKLNSKTRAKLGLAQSEQLDCLGVVKRVGLKSQADQFTAFSRITAHAWIDKIVKDTELKDQFEDVKEAYERLVTKSLATRVKGNKGIYDIFPYDAQFLYRSRLESELRYYQNDDEFKDSLNGLLNTLKPLWRKYGEPSPYGVLLLADGDRMGELLDKAKDIDTHKAITTALSGFAGNVADIMRDYDGHCVYAGGDDVLGFVPLHTAYDCAKALSESFKASLKDIATQLQAINPTLSVGLAIAHMMTPLSVIREYTNQAEKYAKGDHVAEPGLRRNALGILLDVRSGNQTKLRFGWDDTDAHTAFKTWVNLYVNKKIPSRIAYDTRAIDLHTQHIAKKDTVLKQGIQEAELKRMLTKARLINGGIIDKANIEVLNTRFTHLYQFTKGTQQSALQLLSDELIVARWLAAKTQQDLGKDGQ